MRGEHGVGVVCIEVSGSDFEVSDGVGTICFETKCKMGVLADRLECE